MSYKVLPVGITLNKKYEIKKVLSSTEKGAVYLAFDKKVTEKNWIIKEIAPPKELSSDELELRTDKFNQTLEALINYENIHLAKILEHFTFGHQIYVVMEYIQGLTLRQLSDMSTTPVPEKQVLEWALEICDGMYYLHNRPHPFLFDVLTPENVIIDKEGKVKLINFGLDRFFDKSCTKEIFAQSITDLSREFNQFAKTLYFLLTKEDLTDNVIPPSKNISYNLEKVLSKCLDPEANLIYSNFLNLKKELYQILHPPAEVERITPVIKKRKILTRENIQTIKETMTSVANTVLSQKIYYLAGEIVGIILIVFLIWRIFFFVPPYIKKIPTVYVLCHKKEIVAVNKDTYNTVRHFFFEQSFTHLVSDREGKFIYLADSVNNKVVVLDSNNFEIIKSIRVDKNPQKMIVSYDNQKLFIINESTNNISEISIPENKLSNIFPIENSPEDIAISRVTGLIYVICPEADVVSVINPKNYLSIAALKINGYPQAIIISNRRNRIYIAQKLLDSVIVLETYLKEDKFNYKIVQRLNETGGKSPIGLFLDPRENYLFVMNAKTNNLGVIDLRTGKLKNTIELGKSPEKMLFIKPDYLWIINSLSNDISVVDIITHTVKNLKVGKDPLDITFSP